MEPLSKDAEAIEKVIKKKAGAFTLGDIMSSTGLADLESEYGLSELMAKYHSRLHVTENGDLIYDFGSKLLRRDAKSWAERRKAWTDLLWRGFKLFYKSLTAIILVVYFIVFIVILIAMVVALIAGSKGNSRSKGGNPFGIIARMFSSIFRFRTHHRTRYRPWDPWGYPYQHYEPRRTHMPIPDYVTKKGENPKHERQEEKSFIASVYDYVFGPPRIELHPLSNQMEVASYLRQTKGLISTSEVQALAGWTREQASDFMVECLTSFKGKPQISDNGSLYGEFDQLIRTEKNDAEVAPIEFFWDEYEPEYELTGNKKSRDAVITGMNIFNMGFSGFILSGGLGAVLGSATGAGMGALAFLGAFPLLYSITFFAIPFFRSFYIKKKQREQHIQNIRKRLMKVIFTKHKEQISLAELTKVANDWRTTEEILDQKTVQDTLDDFLIDIEGSPTSVAGDVVYDFHRLNQELTDMEVTRNSKILDSNLGDRLELG